MGCGESKHTVATTEPIKKSASRSSSKRVQTPDVATEPVKKSGSRSSSKKAHNPDVATEPVKKSASRSSSKRSQNLDENKPTTTDTIEERPVGVIPGEPFVVQKATIEAPDAAKKEEKKKAVMAVTHDRTTSKESQVSDNFSEDGIEDRSEYESPQLDADRGSNEAVANVVVIEKVKTKEEKNGKKESIIVEEFTKMESGMTDNPIQAITGEEMKQQKEKLETQEGMTQKLDDQVLVAKTDVQETKPILLEDGTIMATEDTGDAKNATHTVVIAEQEVMEPKTAMAEETEITVEQETKIKETDEVKPTELEVRTVSEEKIKDSNT